MTQSAVGRRRRRGGLALGQRRDSKGLASGKRGQRCAGGGAHEPAAAHLREDFFFCHRTWFLGFPGSLGSADVFLNGSFGSLGS
jgi:hypothetical protein